MNTKREGKKEETSLEASELPAHAPTVCFFCFSGGAPPLPPPCRLEYRRRRPGGKENESTSQWCMHKQTKKTHPAVLHIHCQALPLKDRPEALPMPCRLRLNGRFPQGRKQRQRGAWTKYNQATATLSQEAQKHTINRHSHWQQETPKATDAPDQCT